MDREDQDTPVVTLLDDKEPYTAYDKVCPNKPGNFLALDIVERDQLIDTLYYGNVLRLRYSLPRLVSVICIDCVITITGQALGEVRKLIRDRRLEELHIYNPNYHREPPADVPVIQKITIAARTRNPET